MEREKCVLNVCVRECLSLWKKCNVFFPDVLRRQDCISSVYLMSCWPQLTQQHLPTTVLWEQPDKKLLWYLLCVLCFSLVLTLLVECHDSRVESPTPPVGTLESLDLDLVPRVPSRILDDEIPPPVQSLATGTLEVTVGILEKEAGSIKTVCVCVCVHVCVYVCVHVCVCVF